MDNRKLNRRNLLLLLFVLAACVVGGRSIFGFFALLTGYETATTEVSALREGYIEELSKLFDTNIITVEYRYFDDRWGKTLTLGKFFKRRLIRLHPMVVMGALIGLDVALFLYLALGSRNAAIVL